jgi:RimJ/RimL family protein N-acetyltransferase
LKNALPPSEGEEKAYRVNYAVHEILEQGGKSTEFIGVVTLKSLDAGSPVFPEHLTLQAAAKATTPTVELAYTFLPAAWGKGYATESLKAVFESCKRARSFWTPFSKLYVMAIVNELNPASLRVMEKTGMTKKGVNERTTKPIFLGGEWREQHSLHIYGMHLLE